YIFTSLKYRKEGGGREGEREGGKEGGREETATALNTRDLICKSTVNCSSILLPKDLLSSCFYFGRQMVVGLHIQSFL
ncbi:hypothetical protein ACQP3D_30745, partial [Escherichia coli]